MSGRVTIIVNNCNYGQFLDECIRSALEQSLPAAEVVVVDDGSTDDSRVVIGRHAGRVVPVFKENGGQGSAFNAGFERATKGEFVLFLDSDDALERDATRMIVEVFDREPGAVKVQTRMTLVGADGQPLGGEEPPGVLASGDWRDVVLRCGPSAYPSVPTSASAFRRSFLDKVMPVPDAGFERGADAYLKDLAPLYGRVESIQQPLVRYRLHGSNDSFKPGSAPERLNALLREGLRFEACCRAIAEHGARLGHKVSAEDLMARRWQHLVQMRMLARHGLVAHPPSFPDILRGIRLGGTAWKRPMLWAFAVMVCFGPPHLATNLVAGLFRKNRIGWQLAASQPGGAHA